VLKLVFAKPATIRKHTNLMMATCYSRFLVMLRFIVTSLLVFSIFSYAQTYQEAAEAYSEGNWFLSKNILEELIKQNPEHNDAKIKLAFTLIQINKADEAEGLFLEVLARLGEQADIYYGLALANRRLGNYSVLTKMLFQLETVGSLGLPSQIDVDFLEIELSTPERLITQGY